MRNSRQTPLDHLTAVYGERVGRLTYQVYSRLIEKYRSLLIPAPDQQLSQRDAVLITYGDQVRQPDVPHLQTLADFCKQHILGTVSTIHILPFFPYSSDDGFSVIHYRQVDQELGTWWDVERLGEHFKLMFDAVINHISAESEWFKRFLQDEHPFVDYFIVVEGDPDLSQVVRPRALPLLSTFPTPSGEKKVWTTFSADQIDLNFRNPQVLLEILDTLLFYVQHGADLIRLDAIAYLWKEIGTTCIHLLQTHHIVQLIRLTLDEVAPQVQIITETNVPHEENISYFGDGTNEAGLVYNFALPPLVLHTLRTGNSTAISEWASRLSLPSDQVTFFNFLASHDGIGVTPAKGLISPEDIQALIDRTLGHGGRVSYRSNPDGTQSPYELNINYFDALSDPGGKEPLPLQVDRFAAAHGIMFSLLGVPGIYFHSMFGSRGWPEGVRQTSRNRTINRQKLYLDELQADLADSGSLRSTVFKRLKHMLDVRAAYPAFSPYGKQQVIAADARLLVILRESTDGNQRVLCLQNVSDQFLTLDLSRFELPEQGYDILTGMPLGEMHTQKIEFTPYQTRWLSDRQEHSPQGPLQ